jgi:hypothetical protein
MPEYSATVPWRYAAVAADTVILIPPAAAFEPAR